MSVALLLFFFTGIAAFSCGRNNEPETPGKGEPTKPVFTMGVDLSYVNQLEEHGAVYRDQGVVTDPFALMKNNGANTVRVRLWHHPQWVRTVYGNPSTPLYSGFEDVARTIQRSKNQGMKVLLDLHYSDSWADPSKQVPPAAWAAITSLSVLRDSVYNYTFSVLKKLDARSLMPDMVQIGNEINCGMMMTGTSAGFPGLNGCNNQWSSLGSVINSAIQAVRDASANAAVKPLIALHVADPKNVEWWFSQAISQGKILDFDIAGFSYYPLWHTEKSLASLPALVTRLRNSLDRQVMILETAYPWTNLGNDGYTNLFGSQPPLEGFPFTPQGQLDFMVKLTEDMKEAGCNGIFYWEPAWITSTMKDPWGTGSSWENAAFFDFNGNLLPVAGYMNRQ